MSPGRRKMPGERNLRLTLQNESANHNRIWIARVENVIAAKGQVVIVGTGFGPRTVQIPMPAMSFARGASSWIRYMPQVGDYVLVGFGMDNNPQILGYTLWGDQEGRDADDDTWFQSGYQSLQGLGDRAENGMRDFTQLRSGEWDLRSSGGAYLKGSADGTLFAKTGASTLSFRRDRDELTLDTGHFEYGRAGTRLRLGDIKRDPLTPGLPGEPSGASGKEWYLEVGHETALQVVSSYYTEQAGDVRQATKPEVPALGPIGATRYKQQVYDGVPALSTEVYSFTVDALGNVAEEFSGLASPTYTMSGAATDWATSFKSQTHTASSTMALAAPAISLTGITTLNGVTGLVLRDPGPWVAQMAILMANLAAWFTADEAGLDPPKRVAAPLIIGAAGTLAVSTPLLPSPTVSAG